MAHSDDLLLRATAQLALATHIAPKVRSVSLDIDVEKHEIQFRAFLDGEVHGTVLEALRCAVTDINAAYPAPWAIVEEFIANPEPNVMEHLRLVAYSRCEDDWVYRGE